MTKETIIHQRSCLSADLYKVERGRTLGFGRYMIYENLLRKVFHEGSYKQDRTGTGTFSLFGEQIRFDLANDFPLVTTKKIHLKSVIHELLWFIKGDTNIAYLKENGVRIWDEWANEKGDLGPIYGKQWRSWQGANGKTYDQLLDVIHQLRTNPDSRRIIISAWNVGELEDMALMPCHALFQFYVNEGKLSCQLYQRSADIFLGVPFNIASYALLTMMIAQVCDLKLGEFIHTFGDVHLYANHLEQAYEQLTRLVKPYPEMQINPHVKDIVSFTYDDFSLTNYHSHPAIKAPVAV